MKSGAGRPSSTKATSKRAVGVVRVSRVGDRDGEQFVSPSDQSERIRAACERDGLALVDVFEELDVSGGAPLEKRPGLLRAVQMVEAGEAEVVMVAFFDRLVRSLSVQIEVVRRVENAGGDDPRGRRRGGPRRHRRPQALLADARDGCRVPPRRHRGAHGGGEASRCRARCPTVPELPPGYRRGEGKRLEPDPAQAPLSQRPSAVGLPARP